MMRVVQQPEGGWQAIQYASNELKGDLDLVTEAVRTGSWKALRLAPKTVQADRDIVLLALEQDCKMIHDYLQSSARRQEVQLQFKGTQTMKCKL